MRIKPLGLAVGIGVYLLVLILAAHFFKIDLREYGIVALVGAALGYLAYRLIR